VANACSLARDVKGKAIVAMTRTGYTAYQLAKNRPQAEIFAFTNNRNLLNRLNLVWGLRGFFYGKFESTDGSIIDVQHILTETGHLKEGDVVINITSTPIKEHHRANTIKLGVI
jgi:pyruvate kinase